MEEKPTNQPEKKFRSGAISATIWKNQGVSKKTGEQVSFNSVTLQRSYTDKQGQWQNTNNLRLNDLPRAILVLNKTYEYLALKEDSTGQASSVENSETDNEIEEIVM